MRLFVAIPSGRDWRQEFGISMMELTNLLTVKAARKEIESFYIKVQQALLPKARQNLLDEAIKGDYTHILFIDDDMAFPSKAIESMLLRNLDCVCVNGVKRQLPIQSVAYDIDGNNISSEGKTGVQEVSFVGAAVMLVKLDCLKTIERPHFEIRWQKGQECYMPEDAYFCSLLRMSGVKIHIDHDASLMTRHVGSFQYGFRRAG